MTKLILSICAALALVFAVALGAPPSVPTGAVVINGKTVFPTASILSTGTATNITATGTNSIAATALTRVVIATSATGASIILQDGTNTFSTATTTAQGVLEYGASLTTGTLRVITTGSSNLTLITR
jgi:hypothetical protein